jgi:hypothetical protein
MKSESQRRLRYLEDGVSALSLANLIFIQSWFGNLYEYGFGYYSRQPLTVTVLLALLCNLLGCAALFWLGAQVLRRHRKWGLDLVACLFILTALLAPVELLRSSFLGLRDRQMLDFALSLPGLGIGAAVLGAALWRPRWVIRTVTALLLILSPMAFFALAKTMLVVFQLQFQAPPAAVAGPASPPLYTNSPPVRVVWIIFDELDQRLAFAERPAGLALPELDHLCGESLCATNAYPPAGSTGVSIPSLLTGQMFQTAEASSLDDMSLAESPEHQLVQFSQLTNVFDEVRAGGGNTAAVGWYHPYSRLLKRSLNFGAWDPSALSQMRNSGTFGGALKDQWGNVFHTIYWRFWHRHYVEEAIRNSLNVVTNGAYSLALLHLPLPHSPSLFDPAHEHLVTFGRLFPKGYFDNLQLTDRVLGQFRAAMEKSGQWDKTWLLISADHSWRKSSGYDGRSDHRIPFILKPPGHASAISYAPLLNTVVTKDLILALLRGEVRDLPAAETWLYARLGKIPSYEGAPTDE